MRVLLVNDDGICSAGIYALLEAFVKKGHSVMVVAPDAERSGFSHAITFMNIIQVRKHTFEDYPDVEAYAISGTPADCTKLGIYVFSKELIDVVVSGINVGSNLAGDISYSGTFAGAAEAVMSGIMGIATSQTAYYTDYTYASEFTVGLAEKINELHLPKGMVLNVNFPNQGKRPLKGVKVIPPAKLAFSNKYEKIAEEGDTLTFRPMWGYSSISELGAKEGDIHAVREGYISISPIRLIGTDDRALELLKGCEDT